MTPHVPNLVDVSDIYYYFSAQGRGRGSPRRQEGGGPTENHFFFPGRNSDQANFRQTNVRGEKAISINNFRDCPGNGWGRICLCVACVLGKREIYNKKSQETSGKCRDGPRIIPGQSREHFVYVFS